MVLYHKASKTKAKGTGGKKRSTRDKIKAHYGGFFSRTKIQKGTEEERSLKEVKGGKFKVAAKHVLYANVATGKEVKKAKLLTVLTSPDNRHYARENIITAGSLVETDLGKVRVTSRPGQSGIVNAVLVEARKEAPAAVGQSAQKAVAAPAKA